MSARGIMGHLFSTEAGEVTKAVGAMARLQLVLWFFYALRLKENHPWRQEYVFILPGAAQSEKYAELTGPRLTAVGVVGRVGLARPLA